ncbi:MAG: ABC transporter substrate-binding protein [Actinomycetes bacterium]
MSTSFRRVFAALLLLCLPIAACGNSNGSSDDANSSTTAAAGGGGEAKRNEFVPRPGVPGVTAKEISYDVIGTKTGNPLGICILDCYTAGIKAYFAYRNDQGGIFGRKLVVANVIDDELGQNQQKSLDVISDTGVFGLFSATLLPSGWGDLDAAGVPTYTWGIHAADSANRPANFPSLVVRCPDCPRPTVPYVAAQSGATKAASLGYGVSENSKVCAATFAKSFTKYQKESGVALAYTNADLQYGLPNGIGPEVSAMKAKGVNFIATCIDLNGMKTLAQELKRQGMEDVVLYHPNSYDQTFVSKSGDLFEGDAVVVGFRPLEASAEGSSLDEFKAWMKKQGVAPTELAMTGWINASLAFDGLLAAGPEFTRASVVSATNSIDQWTADGLLEPVDWTKAHTPYTAATPRPDPECVALVRVKSGKFVPFGAPSTPWLCFDETSKQQFEPTPTNFE